MSLRFHRLILWALFIITRVLGLFLYFHPKIQSRVKFEHENLNDSGSRSFHLAQEKADLCFEFSSEGEYQQVASLIDDELAAGKKIELVYFSHSVDKTIKDLQKKHPGQIRYLRYPLLTFVPGNIQKCFTDWISSKELILVRYDFFPEFLLWSFYPGRKLKIVWVSFKQERLRGKKLTIYKRLFFKQAKKIFFATKVDQNFARGIDFFGSNYDFRIEQIRRRIEVREQKLLDRFPSYNSFKEILAKYPKEKRIIIGNSWPSDLFLFNNLPQDMLVVIVPHKLDAEILNKFYQHFKKNGRSTIFIDEQVTTLNVGNTYLVNIKGVLCELYADFDKAYVGGGFEASIHSILEPLVAGSLSITCGPKHFRSTEFDLASEFGRIKELTTNEDCLNWMRTTKQMTGIDANNFEKMFDEYAIQKKDLISC